MAMLLKIVAQHWCKAAPESVAKLAVDATRVAPKSRGMTDKNRSRLHQFDSAQNVQTLLDLPRRVFRELKGTKHPDRRDALRAQHALAIEILIAAPMRIGNLVALDLSRHLVSVRSGGRSILHIVIPGEETKTGEPYEVTLPAVTADLLAVFRDRYRPLISGVATSLLFANANGRLRDATAFSTTLSTVVRRETGLIMNVHLFRHMAVTLYMQQHPGDVETARRVLGHKSSATTLRNYAHISTAASLRRYETVMDDLRRQNSGRAVPRLPRQRSLGA